MLPISFLNLVPQPVRSSPGGNLSLLHFWCSIVQTALPIFLCQEHSYALAESFCALVFLLGQGSLLEVYEKPTHHTSCLTCSQQQKLTVKNPDMAFRVFHWIDWADFPWFILLTPFCRLRLRPWCAALMTLWSRAFTLCRKSWLTTNTALSCILVARFTNSRGQTRGWNRSPPLTFLATPLKDNSVQFSGWWERPALRNAASVATSCSNFATRIGDGHRDKLHENNSVFVGKFTPCPS